MLHERLYLKENNNKIHPLNHLVFQRITSSNGFFRFNSHIRKIKPEEDHPTRYYTVSVQQDSMVMQTQQ
jgi:hypothetical protein